MEYLAFGDWVAIAIVHLFFAWKDWDVNVKNLNLGSCGLSGDLYW